MMETLLQVPVIEMPWEDFILLAITAAAGGAFGAAIGALPAFIFTGFVVFLGEGIAILQRELTGEVVESGQLAPGITFGLGFGPITGPHIAFAGGVAATAYAGKKYPEMEPDGHGYHFGKAITYAFGTKPDILAVGAIFGVLGMLLFRIPVGITTNVMGMSHPPTDFVAISVFTTAFIARPVFGYPLVGRPSGDGYLDMSPFEREEPRAAADGGEVPLEHQGRLATEPWLPHQYKWSGVAAIGIAAGLLGGFIWIETGSYFLSYGISAMSLLFLNLGVEKVPVTHHITLLGAVGAAVFMAEFSPVVALLAAGGFGAASALVGEFTQRVFYSHSGTHVDPPAMAIGIMMVIVGVLSLAGVFPNAGFL